MLGKIRKFIVSISELGKAFGYKFMFACAFRRMISFKLYEAYMYRYLTRYFEPIIEQFNNKKEHLEKSDNPSKLYIWTLWWQGEEDAPEVVKACIDSQRKMLVTNDVEYYVLTKDNWKEFIDLPEYILEKVEKGMITLTHFSDIIRAELIRKYGGIWIDATVYCAKPVNLFQRHSSFFTIKMYERSDCYTMRRWTGFLIGDEKNSLLFDFMAEAFRFYWLKEEKLIAYLLIDYLIAIAYEQFEPVKEKIDSIEISNINLWSMLTKLNHPYEEEMWMKYINNTSFFKLSYKDEFNGGTLLEKTKDNKLSYWGWIKSGS